MVEEENGEKWIRAVQGHSIKLVDDDQLLVQLHLKDIDNFCNYRLGTISPNAKSD